MRTSLALACTVVAGLAGTSLAAPPPTLTISVVPPALTNSSTVDALIVFTNDSNATATLTGSFTISPTTTSARCRRRAASTRRC